MFSVVIPLYNKAHTIVATLNSVLRQSFTDFEVVIVDDGSTDNGVALIRETFQDARIKIYTQPNAGVSVARNKGIEKAQKRWIAFLDADDIWEPDYLKYISAAIEMYPSSYYILGGRRVKNVVTGEIFNFIPAARHGFTSQIAFFENPHVFAHISASVVNRAFVNGHNLRFHSGQRCNEDFTFLFMVALLTTVVYVGKPLVTYSGGVDGQATANLNLDIRIRDGALFRNVVCAKWIETNQKNKMLPVFMRYETRHSFLVLLRNRNYGLINEQLSALSDNYKKLILNRFELWIYAKPILRKIAIGYILLTKAIWRLHRFPRINARKNSCTL